MNKSILGRLLCASLEKVGAMEAKVNGFVPYSAGSTSFISMNGNGHVENVAMHNGNDEPSIEELQSELPQVEEGQIPLRELLQRTVQAIYAELTEMAETCEKNLFHFLYRNI